VLDAAREVHAQGREEARLVEQGADHALRVGPREGRQAQGLGAVDGRVLPAGGAGALGGELGAEAHDRAAEQGVGAGCLLGVRGDHRAAIGAVEHAVGEAERGLGLAGGEEQHGDGGLVLGAELLAGARRLLHAPRLQGLRGAHGLGGAALVDVEAGEAEPRVRGGLLAALAAVDRELLGLVVLEHRERAEVRVVGVHHDLRDARGVGLLARGRAVLRVLVDGEARFVRGDALLLLGLHGAQAVHRAHLLEGRAAVDRALRPVARARRSARAS
jgi:hypothetical protein